MLGTLLFDNIQLFSTFASINFVNFLFSIAYFTYLFVSKLRKLTSTMMKVRAESVSDSKSINRKSKFNQKQHDGLQRAMIIQIVQYTVLVMICAVSTIFTVIFPMLAHFSNDPLSQLIFLCIGSCTFQFDMFINYICIIFQFTIYRKWYQRIFGCIDRKITTIFKISLYGTTGTSKKSQSQTCKKQINLNGNVNISIDNNTNTNTAEPSIQNTSVNDHDNGYTSDTNLNDIKTSNIEIIGLRAATTSATE